jgi:N-dimethylarginine dimethylaminohydrolase
VPSKPLNQGNTNSIPVNIPSEFATLRRVVMCLANTMSVFSFLRQGGFDIAAIYQLWRNKWAIIHHYQRVRQQQRAFIEVMERNGVEVLFAEAVPGCFTQHYTRDIGFAIDDTFFCANPRRHARQRELEGLRNLLPRFSKVARLENGTIEGGNVIVDEQYIIVGLGEETSKEGIDCLRRKCRELRIDRDIITLEFAHRGIIHLDTRFNIPSRGIGLVHPKSFKTESLKWLENRFDLIVATDEETANVEINTFALSPRKLVMRERSHRLALLLESKGIETILIDFSEVTKLPGSFRCATLPIEREKHGAR